MLFLCAIQKEMIYAPTEGFAEWSEAKPSALIAEFPAKSPSDWIFPVFAREAGAYLWDRASVEVKFKEGWRTAHPAALPVFTPFGISEHGEVRRFSIPLTEEEPTELRLTLPIRKTGKSIQFRFDTNLNASPMQHGLLPEHTVRILSPSGGSIKQVTAFLCDASPSPDCIEPKLEVPVVDGVARMLAHGANIVFLAPGYGLTAFPLDKPFVEARMEPEVRITGRVVDEAGMPLQGVRIGLTDYRPSDDGPFAKMGFGRLGFKIPPWLLSKFSDVTDAKGGYRINGLSPGVRIFLGPLDDYASAAPRDYVALPDAPSFQGPDIRLRKASAG